MKISELVVAPVLALGIAAAAQAEGRQALVGGTLIDGYGGPVVHDSVILVEDDRIIAVGNQDNTAIPDGYEVISTEG